MLKELREGFFLIGVAHVLPESMQEVRETIEKEHPEVVALELDHYRYSILTHGVDATPGEKASPKPSATILTGLMTLLQEKFSNQTGMPAGNEMAVAIERAMATGAKVELIDQDIRVTMNQINETMPLSEKLMLMVQIMLSLLPTRKHVNLERLTEEQVVKDLLDGFKRLSPTSYRVLIEERNAYMASKVFPLLKSNRRVVCVVGAGHVPGMQRLLEEALRESKAEVWWEMNIGFKQGG